MRGVDGVDKAFAYPLMLRISSASGVAPDAIAGWVVSSIEIESGGNDSSCSKTPGLDNVTPGSASSKH